MDRDSPSGVGDWETEQHYYPSSTACADGSEPTGVQCRTAEGQLAWDRTPYAAVLYCDPALGFRCKNDDVVTLLCGGNMLYCPRPICRTSSGSLLGSACCDDFEVRFYCGGEALAPPIAYNSPPQ